MSKKKALVGILRLNQVEVTSRGVSDDVEETLPFNCIHGDRDKLWQIRGSWVRHLKIITEGSRDYYMFSMHRDNVDYLLAPGDYVMVYEDGGVQALVGLSAEDVASIYARVYSAAD